MADANTSPLNNIKASQHKITVNTVDGGQDNHVQITFDPADKTLLNNLENNNIEAHYHCRDGFCGACRVILVSGEINYPTGEPLAFVAENEILTCCCAPTSDISIKID